MKAGEEMQEAPKGKKKKTKAEEKENQNEAPEAIEEDREPSEKKEKSPGKKTNWLGENKAIAALSIVLIAVAALAANNLISGLSKQVPEISIGEFHNSESAEKPKFLIVYSSECKDCEMDFSLVLLLAKNKIDFLADKFEASSPDGKRIIEELGLKKLPAMLVDGKSLSDKMVVKSDAQFQIKSPSGTITLKDLLLLLVEKYPREASYSKAADIFALQELGLDGSRHIDFILRKACAPENPQSLARVDLFVDPYSTPYIKSTETLDFYRDYYKGRMEFNYHYLPIEASKKFDPQIPIENIENLANYLACADRQGFLMKAESAFYSRYCALDDLNVLSSTERNKCADSNHFGWPILGSEAQLISNIDLNYNKKEFSECLGELPQQFAEDAALAESLQVYRVPTAVINCKYSTHTINIDKALCKLNPDMEHCKFFG